MHLDLRQNGSAIFEIINEIGRGGMGVVYAASQISFNRRVALEILANELGLTSKSIERFRFRSSRSTPTRVSG